MQNINLLPPRYLQKKELHKYIKKMAAIQAALFLLYVLIVYALDLTNGYIQQVSARYDTMLADPVFAQGDAAAAALRAKTSEWEKRGRILHTLDAQENISSQTILTLTEHLPAQMDIRSVKTDGAGGIDVQAAAARKRLVSEYLDALEDYFLSCELVSLTAGEDGVHASFHMER